MPKPPAVPTPEAEDRIHTAVRAAISAIPGFGGPAAEFFQMVIRPPLERRRDQWLQDLSDRVDELCAGGEVTIEDLAEDEAFLTAVLQATPVAMRTHSEEKREALRNAIESVALGQSPSDALQHIFFNYIDELSELHLRILKAAHSPQAPPGMSSGGFAHTLEHMLPDIREQQTIYRQVWRDLYARGLVGMDNLNLTMNGSSLGRNQCTDLGERFIEFMTRT